MTYRNTDKVNPSKGKEEKKMSRTGMNNSARPSLPHQDGVVVRNSSRCVLGGVGGEKGICIFDRERGAAIVSPGDVSCFNGRARIMRQWWEGWVEGGGGGEESAICAVLCCVCCAVEWAPSYKILFPE